MEREVGLYGESRLSGMQVREGTCGMGKPRAESRAQLTERSWASGFVTSITGASTSTSRETPDLRLGGNRGQRARETGHASGLHSAPITPSMRSSWQTTPGSIVEQDERQK